MKNDKNIKFINASKLKVLTKMFISYKLKLLKKETVQI